MVNSYKFNNVIEIGCGLCDILSRIRCDKKTGVDIDKNIIKACKMLFNKIKFINGCMLEDYYRLNLNQGNNISKKNLLICLNWPHGYSWVEIKKALKFIFINYDINYLMIDIINYDPNNQYEFHHTEEDLLKMGNIIIKEKIKNSNRTLYLINFRNIDK